MWRLVTRMFRRRRPVTGPTVRTYYITSSHLSIGQLRRLEIEAILKMTNDKRTNDKWQ